MKENADMKKGKYSYITIYVCLVKPWIYKL